MKKKLFLLLAAFSLVALPVAASAAEFTLGGYIKLEAIWDSTQIQKNLLGYVARNNDPNFHHGRLKMTAENTRMWFLIKGPKIWGAQITGYIEWDFDEHANVNTASGALGYSPHKARIGLRHAFFRLNWPTTELLMGQYWSLMTEEIPETANFGAATTAGQPFLRTPQIRLTQKFCDFTFSLALAEPENGLWGLSLDPTQSGNSNVFAGESSETPKVEGRIKYEANLWGQAPYWGAPRGFSAGVAAAWWRTRYRGSGGSLWSGRAFDNNWDVLLYQGANTNRFWGYGFFARDQQYLNHWLVEGRLFIPVIPMCDKNPAGSLSILTQWFVGAGLDGYFEDFPANSSYFVSPPGPPTDATYMIDRKLMKRYGGYVQAQYWFNSQWYLNAAWAMNKAFDVDMATWVGVASTSDPVKFNQHYYLTLWYRPIQALKFGLEYTYVRTEYFQRAGPSPGSDPGVYRVTDFGENHRLLFCGFFFF